MPEKNLAAGVVSNDVTGNSPVPPLKSSQPEPVTAPEKGATPETPVGGAVENDIPESELPQRLRGAKTFKDAVGKYREIESELGRKNNEVGQLRYVIDQMLQLKRQEDTGGTAAAKAKPEHAPVTTDALLNDPETAISSVASRAAKEAAESANERIDRMEFEAAKGRFEGQFPKYKETQEDPAFLEWVKASRYRLGLAHHAAGGSFDSATELFAAYEELKKETKTPATPDLDTAAAKGAALVRPGTGNASTQGRATPPKQGSKEILSRHELGLLYIRDRAKYNAMSDEIATAYREGRVK